MKKVVNRKIYDIKKAQIIHTWTNGKPKKSEYYEEESLYITEKGRYFLLGFGGNMTMFYLAEVSSMKFGNYRLLPITKEKAMDWLESHEGDKILIDTLMFKEMVDEG